MDERKIEPAWLSYRAAERYSGLSHTTLWRHINSGELKAAKVGRSVRIQFRSLSNFMQEHSKTSEQNAIDTGGNDQ